LDEGKARLGVLAHQAVDQMGGRALFRLGMTVGAAVRLGGFGFSLVSDTFFGGTNNTAIAASGSFLDAHVGLAAGYATFTRADGSRAARPASAGTRQLRRRTQREWLCASGYGCAAQCSRCSVRRGRIRRAGGSQSVVQLWLRSSWARRIEKRRCSIG
jgi:hypothetical protein